MSGYPIVFDLSGGTCLVVGGGTIALRKVQGLLSFDAQVRAVSPQAVPELTALAAHGEIEWKEKSYERGDLEGMLLVISATDDMETNRRVAEDARAAGIPVNVVDQPELCTFTVPSIVQRGDLVIAIQTGGRSPALARRLREELELRFGPEYGPYVDFLGRMREWIREHFHDDPDKRYSAAMQLIELDLIHYFVDGKEDLAEEVAKKCILSSLD